MSLNMGKTGFEHEISRTGKTIIRWVFLVDNWNKKVRTGLTWTRIQTE